MFAWRQALIMKAPAGESFLDSQSIYCVFRKNLSVDALNDRLRERFKKFYDTRDPNRTTIPLVDALMSAFAMFTLKIPSMLALDKYRMSAEHSCNLSNLFGVEKLPSDTAMREILDEVDSDQLRVAFKDVFHELQRGKSLEQYVFMDLTWIYGPRTNWCVLKNQLLWIWNLVLSFS